MANINFQLIKNVEQHLATIKEFLKDSPNVLHIVNLNNCIDVNIRNDNIYGYVSVREDGCVLRIFIWTSANSIEIPLNDMKVVFSL